MTWEVSPDQVTEWAKARRSTDDPPRRGLVNFESFGIYEDWKSFGHLPGGLTIDEQPWWVVHDLGVLAGEEVRLEKIERDRKAHQAKHERNLKAAFDPKAWQ